MHRSSVCLFIHVPCQCALSFQMSNGEQEGQNRVGTIREEKRMTFKKGKMRDDAERANCEKNNSDETKTRREQTEANMEEREDGEDRNKGAKSNALFFSPFRIFFASRSPGTARQTQISTRESLGMGGFQCCR